jgi:hypothetical protein
VAAGPTGPARQACAANRQRATQETRRGFTGPTVSPEANYRQGPASRCVR